MSIFNLTEFLDLIGQGVQVRILYYRESMLKRFFSCRI